MKIKIAWVCFILAAAVCGWSCKKNSADTRPVKQFDPAVQGLAVKPLAQLDPQRAEFIVRNKKAIIAGEEVIPPIGMEDTAAAPVEAPAIPTAMPGAEAAMTPTTPPAGMPAAAPTRSADPFGTPDPNSGSGLPW